TALLLLAMFAPQAHAKVCNVAIHADDAMKFSQTEIKIAATCSQVTLTLKHTGSFPAEMMGHNWVLAGTKDFQSLAAAGEKSTLANSYLPKGDARVIAFTKVVGGGESTTITFPTSKLSKGGDYTFFCSFPGHWSLMKGKLTFL
ncbi:MAG: azurin, partial [Pseudoxanthomonas sp.]